MPINEILLQPGLSLPELIAGDGTDVQCQQGLPEGVLAREVCLPGL
jgi:hypothetical protein